MQFGWNYYGHSLFITLFMKLLHDRMLIGIDREHRKAHPPLARDGVGPAVPQAGNAKRVTAGQRNLPAHGLARLVAGFVKVIDQHQAVLALSPSGTVAGLLCNGFAAGVVGVTTDLVVLGPSGDQAKPSQAARNPTGLVAFDNDRRSKPWVGLFGVASRQINAQLFFEPLSPLGWGEIGAHRQLYNGPLGL